MIRKLDGFHPDSALVTNHDGMCVPLVFLQVSLFHRLSTILANHEIAFAVYGMDMVVGNGDVPFTEKKVQSEF